MKVLRKESHGKYLSFFIILICVLLTTVFCAPTKTDDVRSAKENERIKKKFVQSDVQFERSTKYSELSTPSSLNTQSTPTSDKENSTSESTEVRKQQFHGKAKKVIYGLKFKKTKEKTTKLGNSNSGNHNLTSTDQQRHEARTEEDLPITTEDGTLPVTIEHISTIQMEPSEIDSIKENGNSFTSAVSTQKLLQNSLPLTRALTSQEFTASTSLLRTEVDTTSENTRNEPSSTTPTWNKPIITKMRTLTPTSDSLNDNDSVPYYLSSPSSYSKQIEMPPVPTEIRTSLKEDNTLKDYNTESTMMVTEITTVENQEDAIKGDDDDVHAHKSNIVNTSSNPLFFTTTSKIPVFTSISIASDSSVQTEGLVSSSPLVGDTSSSYLQTTVATEFQKDVEKEEVVKLIDVEKMDSESKEKNEKHKVSFVDEKIIGNHHVDKDIKKKLDTSDSDDVFLKVSPVVGETARTVTTIIVSAETESAQVEKIMKTTTLKPNEVSISMGHDGIKVTKKKQLLENNFKEDVRNLHTASNGSTTEKSQDESESIFEREKELYIFHQRKALDEQKMKNKKPFHIGRTNSGGGGHLLGPLIFKERIVSEDHSKGNGHSNIMNSNTDGSNINLNENMNTEHSKSFATSSSIGEDDIKTKHKTFANKNSYEKNNFTGEHINPTVKSEETSTAAFTDLLFPKNLTFSEYRSSKLNKTLTESEKFRKIAEFFPTNASISDIYRSKVLNLSQVAPKDVEQTTTKRVSTIKQSPPSKKDNEKHTTDKIFTIISGIISTTSTKSENVAEKEINEENVAERNSQITEKYTELNSEFDPLRVATTTTIFSNDFHRKIKEESLDIGAISASTKEMENSEIESTQNPYKSTFNSEYVQDSTIAPTLFTNRYVPMEKHSQKIEDTSRIEIEINVSEGNGSFSGDVMQFSFRNSPLDEKKENTLNIQLTSNSSQLQSNKLNLRRTNKNVHGQKTHSETITLKPVNRILSESEFYNDTDILVVEITDGDNTTDANAYFNSENLPILNENPKYAGNDYDSKNSPRSFQDYDGKSQSSSRESSNSEDDDLFVPDLKLEPYEDLTLNNGHNYRIVQEFDKHYPKDPVDRDSDTIFYISNTEVKVVESVPTTNTNIDGHNESKFQLATENFSIHSDYSPGSSPSLSTKNTSQFFPQASFYEEDVLVDISRGGNSTSMEKKISSSSSISSPSTLPSEKYEEKIVLSPLNGKVDKLITNHEDETQQKDEQLNNSRLNNRNQHLSDDNVSVSYVAESFIDAEEFPVFNEHGGDLNRDSNKNNITSSLNSILKDKNSYGSVHFNEGNNDGKETSSSTSDININQSPSLSSNVIIQPANIPEISIGVPVIGELPPEIELKELDFIPNSDNNKNANNDDVVQYGSDLIATNINTGNSYELSGGYPTFGGGMKSYSGKFRDMKNYDNYNIDDNDVMVTSQIVMHPVNNFQKDQLMAEMASENVLGMPEGRRIPSGDMILNNTTPGKVNGNNSTMPEVLRNATAYSVLDDSDGEFNFTDIQTLFLACFATLVPLVLSVLLAFGLRYLWRKYRRDSSDGTGLVGDMSTDPLAAKSMTLSQDELMKSTESGYTINHSNDTLESSTEILSKHGINSSGCGGGGGGVGGICFSNNFRVGGGCDGSGVILNGHIATNKVNPPGVNGSVITMTLKNNHLIVETEERNDISRDARETKMHYTPSEKDGVFVVEVARGADSAAIPESPNKNGEGFKNKCILDIDPVEKPNSTAKVECNSKNHEEVQIHQPPTDGRSDKDVKLETNIEMNDGNSSMKNEPSARQDWKNLGGSNIGLSQSDLSTSSGDSNHGYSYGNQRQYTDEPEECPPLPPQLLKVPSPVLASSPKKTIPSNPGNENGGGDDDYPVEESEQNSDNGDNSNNGNNQNGNGTAGDVDDDDEEEEDEEDSQNGEFKRKSNGGGVLLKQDTVIEVTIDKENNTTKNSIKENGNEENDSNNITSLKNEIFISNDKNAHQLENGDINMSMDNGQSNETENGFDSIISLPAPPSTEEMKQMNDIILTDNSQLDSLPPPPPPDNQVDTMMMVTATGASQVVHPTSEQNGIAVVAVSGSS